MGRLICLPWMRSPRIAANDEWRAPLHEEVARLPERFRLPVVLCYLEGKTHAQAAFELRWGEATLRRRLSDARDLLRSRLTRRGVAVSSGALAAALTREATAAVPTGWADVTGHELPWDYVAGSIAAVRLAEMLVRGMFVGQIQSIATAVLILVAVSMVAPHLVPAGLASAEASKGGRSTSAAPLVPSPPAPIAPPKPEQPDVAAEPEQTVTVSGRVLDPEGKPFAGAKIYAYRQFPRGDIFGAGPPAPDAISDADGRFRFQIADPGFLTLQIQATWSHPIVAALARGFGPGWTSFTTADEAKDVTLKLVRDDVPIVGRVLDLEGRPVQGVTIRPIGLNASPDENLAGWEAAMAGAKDIYDPAMRKLPKHLELLRWRNDLAVTTGTDGRFRLTGIGRERVVSLWIEGPTIVTSFADIHARTRPGPTYRIAGQRDKPEFGTLVYHGATFDHAAAPTRPIEGTVRDKDTGKPLAGVSIRSDRFAANIISGRDHVRTISDAQGRYRLVGMPGGDGNVITASRRPSPALPRCQRRSPRRNGHRSRPRLTSHSSAGWRSGGRSATRRREDLCRRSLSILPFQTAPIAAMRVGLHGGEVHTGKDGSFELVGLPGRGLIAARAEKDHFLVGQGADTIPGADEHGWFLTDPHLCDPNFLHVIAEIKPAEGAESLTCDLVLDPGNEASGNRGRPRRQAPGRLHRHQPLPWNHEPQHGQAHLRRVHRDRPRSEAAAAAVLPP